MFCLFPKPKKTNYRFCQYYGTCGLGNLCEDSPISCRHLAVHLNYYYFYYYYYHYYYYYYYYSYFACVTILLTNDLR